LVLVKKSDGTYRVRVNFKVLNKIIVFDPEPIMSTDDIFPKLSGSQFYSTFGMVNSGSTYNRMVRKLLD